MEGSIFIEVLKYGEQVGLAGTMPDTITNWAESTGVLTKNKDPLIYEFKKKALLNLFYECFQPAEARAADKFGHSYVLKPEYYFRLIEHRELQESRQAAKSAKTISMWAIGISVAAIIVSTVLTFTRLYTPTRINKSDLTTLINSNTVQREVKLDRLQIAQILSAIGDNPAKPISDSKKALNQTESHEISHHELINQYFENE